MLLNCDMGESFGAWTMGNDAAVMPHIDMASIACGFHAGDPQVMQTTVRLAVKHQVRIGAHPSYPDLAGFGRRSMHFSDEQLAAILHYQIGALQAICALHGSQIDYVKPHGALYNDMQRNPELFATVLRVIDQCNQQRQQPLQLLTLASIGGDWQQQQAARYGIPLLFEAFADRRYDPNGQLRARTHADAVLHDAAEIIAQVSQLATGQAIRASDGSALMVQADTLCVHGDNAEAVALVKTIRQHLLGMAHA
ncbi:5-oxoprolinase subunit PxpA [Pseudidiomarina mangrovi]|uniref:5-oxoprolinase subunit PxpA n=1 Tax=Pseudidiomarina mangrovi TaxID=2487133 RepID=UPI00196B7E91|nr:5-oxoprolinase subunit PxpA [Pseudidiomarina mangrovi]